MIVACHQPNYIPWPGYFSKISGCDVFVFLDSVQFPRGGSFVNRNRIKTPSGRPLWLTVPVQKKGKGLQPIARVSIDNDCNWMRKHLLSLLHCYAQAPYFREHADFFAELYRREWAKLAELNTTIIEYLAQRIGCQVEFRLSSNLGVEAKGTDLLVAICQRLGADTYLSGSTGRKYLEERKFTEKGIALQYYSYYPSVYPQLWGDFIPKLSVLDFLFNCGEKALRTLLDIEGK